jgi:Fic family protein
MSWPAVTHETLEWQRAGRPEVAYEAAVPASIAGLTPEVSPGVAALAEEASYELVRVDAGLGGHPALRARTCLIDAIASSRIEGVISTAGAALTAGLTGAGNPDAIMVAANQRAIMMAWDLPTIDPHGMRQVHAELMAGLANERPGEYRDSPVWIGRGGSTPATAEFVPPATERVPALIADLAGFTSRVGIPVLTQAAVAHAQYETVHPHADGNGRAGRAFIHTAFRNAGLTRNMVMPLSAGILANRRSYVPALEAYRAGDVNPIVECFAEATLHAARATQTLERDLDHTRAHWAGRVQARGSSGVWRALDLLPQYPVITAELLAEQMGIATTNAYRHLNQLAEAGVLTATPVTRVGTTWVAGDILSIVDRYAQGR